MTKKTTTNIPEDTPAEQFLKLSIQVSLSGLSFCILDTISNQILVSESISFGRELTPYEVKKELKTFIETNNVTNKSFSEVIVTHRNQLSSLVPKALFDADELANYLKFNTKILANDFIAYDIIENHDIVNVYVPFANINNYIYDLFGEFSYMHHGSVLIQTLLGTKNTAKEPVCYVHLTEEQMDITVIANKKLLLYNSFTYTTKEDFIYYLLFVLEQLDLDTNKVLVRLFGTIEEGDTIYRMCYKYIKNMAVSVPDNGNYELGDLEKESIDFTLINAL